MVHVLCSDRKHPIYEHLRLWCLLRGAELHSGPETLRGGDTLFLISCTHYIKKDLRDKFRRVWVIHESNLPQGRGWSPLAWQILEGKNEITVSLLEAEERIDAGGILRKEKLILEGHELYDEMQEKLFRVKTRLMDFALTHSEEPLMNQFGEISHYPKRTAVDSKLDPHQTLAEQFNLLRICEPRFPAFFEYMGHKYEVTIRKL